MIRGWHIGPAVWFCALAPLVSAHNNASESHGFVWTTDWEVIAPIVLTGLLYVCGVGRVWRLAGVGHGISRLEVGFFIAGWFTLVIALISPLDALADRLFSVHMVQHELLMVVAAPLLVLGRPFPAWLWALPLPWRRRIGAWANARGSRRVFGAVTAPLPAWLLHAIAVWIWHVPALFNAALSDRWIHSLQHASFLFTGLMFWSVTLSRRCSDASTSVFLLFTTMVHTGALGALLTFSTVPWFAIDAKLAISFGLSGLEDQQLGGLIMWVPAGLVYPTFALWLLMRSLESTHSTKPLLRDDSARQRAC